VERALDAAKYSAIELLRNGRRIEIRALKPEDRDQLGLNISSASISTKLG
jgi:hypothetical protein